MIKSNLTPTSETGEEKYYIKKLQKAIESYRFSQNQLAAKIGISSGILSQIMRQEYPFNADNYVWSQIRKFFEKVEANFYETKLVKVMWRCLNTVFSEKKIAVITSCSGAGKTTSIERYTLHQPNAMHIRITEVFTTKYLLERMCAAVNAPYLGLTKQTMYESIIEITQRRERLFVIDEAERLSIRQLELLRDIYDEGNIGLCLVGLDSLRTLLQKGRSLRENLVQLYSRVAYNEVVDILDPTDVKMILDDKLKHTVSKPMMKKLSRLYRNRGGLRAILMLCNLSTKVAEMHNVKSINDELIDHCINELTL